MLNWNNQQEYQFTNTLNAEQWAWEYLRRNPCYRIEWRDFNRIWHELEAAYGKPGERDIAAWKQDSRAWVSVAECKESDCRIDNEKVLIECAMGARWGFYKFPPDPADDDPVGEGRLKWREFTLDPGLLRSAHALRELPAEFVLLSFDLSLPLRAQLVSAKRRLQIEQRNRVQAGTIRAPRVAAHREMLCRMLRLLDAMEDEVSPEQIEAILYSEATASSPEERDKAIRLRDHDYCRLLLLD